MNRDFFSLIEQQQDDPPAPPETSDPFEVLARQEIEFGINLRGVPIPKRDRIRIAVTLDIDLNPD